MTVEFPNIAVRIVQQGLGSGLVFFSLYSSLNPVVQKFRVDFLKINPLEWQLLDEEIIL